MASPVSSSNEGTFKTPKNVRVRSPLSSGGTPITIPASPFMKKLGCGTGVNVYLMNRFVVLPEVEINQLPSFLYIAV